MIVVNDSGLSFAENLIHTVLYGFLAMLLSYALLMAIEKRSGFLHDAEIVGKTALFKFVLLFVFFFMPRMLHLDDMKARFPELEKWIIMIFSYFFLIAETYFKSYLITKLLLLMGEKEE